MQKTIICILSKTSGGKDTASRYIKTNYNINPVISYATRPQRSGEINGREHIFISDDEMNKLLSEKKDKILAYTKFPKTNYQYCATTDLLEDDKPYVYIIDPIGYRYLKSHFPNINIISIYIDVPETIIKERALKRGDNTIDIDRRLDSERKMFDDYRDSKQYNYFIDNSGSFDAFTKSLDIIMNEIISKRSE